MRISTELPIVDLNRIPDLSPDELVVGVSLVTPLLGGGVETRHMDPLSWLRGPSLKGHLRYWWRAAFGYRYHTVEEMWSAEGELFGAVGEGKKGALQSRVVLRVEAGSIPGIQFPGNPNDLDTYALFPALSSKGHGGNPSQPPAHIGKPDPPCTATIGLRLRDDLSPDQSQEVIDALALWCLFGGAGSRSRRGAGQVVPEPPGLAALAERKWKDPVGRFTSLLAGKRPPSWEMFSLQGTKGWFQAPEASGMRPEEIWKTMLKDWKEIRKSPPDQRPPPLRDKRAILGLPLPHFRAKERYASPILHALSLLPPSPSPVGTVLVTRSQSPATQWSPQEKEEVINRVVNELHRRGYKPLYERKS